MIKYHNRYLAALCAAGIMAVSACSSVKNTTGSTAKGKVVFFDDFSDAKIDRNKWNAVVTGLHVNDELQAYVDSAAVMYTVNGDAAQGAGNGALVLKPQFAPNFKTKDGQTFNFISGRLNTQDKFEFTYGTAEARIKVTDGQGLWPAWWLLGTGEWPHTGEIDIMEYVGESDWVSAAVHGPGYSGETPFVNKQYFDKQHDATQWHVYAVDWTPESLTFKYDGVIMFKVTKPMVQHYGKWVFDGKQYLILNFAVGGIYPAKTNGIKKPYYGLPESSADMIKNGKATMLVDWVKVTQTGK